MKRFTLTKEQAVEFRKMYEDYIKHHKNEKNRLLKADKDGDEKYDVDLEGCVQVCETLIRIPTERYCGEKVHPRQIEKLHEYSYYEKSCLLEILKEYPSELSDYVSSYLMGALNENQ